MHAHTYVIVYFDAKRWMLMYWSIMFLPIMSDYTLIASKQSIRLLTYTLHTLFGSQWFGVFWQRFGSDHQNLVANLNGRHDVTAAPCSRTSILHVSTVTFLPTAQTPTSTSNLSTYLERQSNIDSNDALSVWKYYQLLMHESNTFLL